MHIMDVTNMATETPPIIGIKLEREATMLDFNVSKGPPRPLTSSPMSEPPTSPVPMFSPVPEYPPATQGKPSQADTDELLEFIRNEQNMKGFTVEREPTISWTEKKRPLLPDIPKTPREPKQEQQTAFPEFGHQSAQISPNQSGLSRSLEHIPGPNPKLLEQKRLQAPSVHGKRKVTRLRSLPPIEASIDRPSAPTPMHRASLSMDAEELYRLSDNSSPEEDALVFTI